MKRLSRLLAALSYAYHCTYCGAGPFGEAELAAHMANAHPNYPR
jgi:hypothetical protein